MKRQTWLLPLVGLAILGSLPAAQTSSAPMRVFAVGDWFRIEPTSGKAFEATFFYSRRASRRLPQSSLVWDGATERVAIKAARNEFVSFQVVVERTSDAPLRHVDVKMGPLTGPGGAIIPTANIDTDKEWYLNVLKRTAQDYSLGPGLYPDALIPTANVPGRLFPQLYILPFDVPILSYIGPDQRNQAVWVDVYVPRDRRQAPPGDYESTVTVTTASGDRAQVTVKLTLWDFAIPEETHIAGNIHNDTELNTFTPELELKYYQMIRRHRLAMASGDALDITVKGSDIQFD